FAASAFVAGATFARIFAGHLVDVVGKRGILVVALALAVLVAVLYLPAHSLGMLIAVRMLHCVVFTFASTASMTLAQGAVPPARRAEGTGYLALSSSLATAIGPALVLLIVRDFDYDLLFWTTIAIAMAGL